MIIQTFQILTSIVNGLSIKRRHFNSLTMSDATPNDVPVLTSDSNINRIQLICTRMSRVKLQLSLATISFSSTVHQQVLASYDRY